MKTFYEIDLRVDKSFYFKGVMLGFYIDLQNVLNFKYDNQPLLISTGETYVDEAGTERYRMKYIAQQSGSDSAYVGHHGRVLGTGRKAVWTDYLRGRFIRRFL